MTISSAATPNSTSEVRRRRRLATLSLVACAPLCGCGGGGGSSPAPPPPAPPPQPASALQVSGQSPFAPGCALAAGETLYLNAAVEPYLAVSPIDARVMVGVWQQDRWFIGGARGILNARSVDAGSMWTTPTPPPLSHCMGGSASNGGDYDRVSDPWVAFSADGATVYQAALAYTTGVSSSVVVSVSADNGLTWSTPKAVVRDAPDTTFNDKDAITADAVDPNYAYVVWDRSSAHSPAMVARTSSRGADWQAMQVLFDPGAGNATIGNVIVALTAGTPQGTLVDFFTQYPASGTGSASLRAIRSIDQGQTWPSSTLATIAQLNSVQTNDPVSGLPVRDGSILGSFSADPRAGSTVVYAAWEDATPVASHKYNAIVLARSVDGGATWSNPVRVNADLTVPAFNPSLTVRGDGEIGLAYYDFRGSLVSSASAVTYWLARSSDNGATWTESRIDGPFDLLSAPNVRGGYFLGDYEALTWSGTDFLPFYAKSGVGAGGLSRVYFNSFNLALGKAASLLHARRYSAVPLVSEPRSKEFERTVADNLSRNLSHRRPTAE